MNKTMWLIIGLVVVVLAGIIFMLTRSKPEEGTNQNTTTPVAKTASATPVPPAQNVFSWQKGGTAIKGTYADADVVKLAESNYRMYYSIQPEVKNNNFEVYSATSTNGKTWTQEAGTRKTMATFPDVVKLVDGKFRMYFQSAGVIKSAISTDGLKFTDEAGTRIDKTDNITGLYLDNVAAPTVYQTIGQSYAMVYRGTVNTPYAGEKVPNTNTQLLFWATSPDGLSWNKQGLALDSRAAPYYGLADGPEIFTWDDDTVRLSFWTYTGVYWSKFNINDFTTTTNPLFSAPEKVFALANSTPQNKFPTPTPGDPTYAKFNNVWYMYYGQNTSIDYATYGVVAQ